MAGIEPIEVLGEQLLYVQDVLIDMAEDGITVLVHALLQDFDDDVLEGVGIVQMIESQ